MGEIKRLYVEKKTGCDIEAQHLLHDLQENLGITELLQLRILNRYDIEGISEEDYRAAVRTIFSEPPVDIVSEEDLPCSEDELVFAVEYLPGQYDQRADSAMQCIQLLSQAEKPMVSAAKVYLLKGSLSREDIAKIKSYCINPVDSQEAAIAKPETLSLTLQEPQPVDVLSGFCQMEEDALAAWRTEQGLAMSEEDLLFCQAYFRDMEQRDPSITEIRVIDTYWSDHCRHTTFLTRLSSVTFQDGVYRPAFEQAYERYLAERAFVYGEQERDITLMDMAVMGMKSLRKQGLLPQLDASEEINACSIVVPVMVNGVQEDWLIQFKNETHNHPTEIEPFGGAATCLGGAIRDPLSGRAYIYQAMRVTGAGDPTVPVSETLAGKLPQRKIVTEAARGYSSYGNQIGLATGQVTEIYDPGFVAKRMEIGAVIGAVKKEHVVREVPVAGDVILLIGGRTGRDGCGGATGSSKEHTAESITECGAEVQKGNAPTERKLQRLFRNPEVTLMIKRCNDFGAGGVSVAIGELAPGLTIDLDAVPKKYEGLDGTELAISESQERMAVVVAPENAAAMIAFAAKENLEATEVARVTEEKRLMMHWRKDTIVDLSRDFLDTNGVTQAAAVSILQPVKGGFPAAPVEITALAKEDLKAAWLKNISQLNVASQKGLCERFDSTVGAGTVLMPFGGKHQLTPPEAMAAKVPVLHGETSTATLMSFGYSPSLAKWSPFHGAVYAVVSSVAKIVATGGDYTKVHLTFQEYFEKLGDDPQKWGKPTAALLGAFRAQMELGLAAIGGKDSMSGTFLDMHVPPSLVSFAVGYEDAHRLISPEFKKPESLVVYLPLLRDKYDLPDFAYLKRMFNLIQGYIEKGICLAVKTVGIGGIAEAVTKMAFGNQIGVKLNDLLGDLDLFVPAFGSFVLELDNPKVLDFQGLEAVILGETTKEAEISAPGFLMPLSEAQEAWFAPLEKVFPTTVKQVPAQNPAVSLYHAREKRKPSQPVAKPSVLIPVFPGTNCEYDSQRAFEKAGAKVEQLVICNLSVQALDETIERLTAAIDRAQIVMFPGGFSAGDEPEGSGKFMAATFRNPRIQEAVARLLEERDGLMLGICNGFQALIKLGLLPYGKIQDITKDSPTLTYNQLGRHISCMVDTKVTSNISPWLWGVEAGDIHTIPVSHGEGRFLATPAMLAQLEQKGQIATQYVDPKGKPTYDTRYNPNGSMLAIEGITSPDGRILGKMGHSERIGNGLYRNVPGSQEQKIFASGVRYFSE